MLAPLLLFFLIASCDLHHGQCCQSQQVKDAIDIPMHMVDAHNVVPGEAMHSTLPLSSPPPSAPPTVRALALAESCAYRQQQPVGTPNDEWTLPLAVWEASDKREYGARTIRTKIHKKLPEFMKVCVFASASALQCIMRQVD